MKGISAIIATVLLLLITISLAGTAYIFTSGMLSGRTDKAIEVLTSDVGMIIIRNVGTEDIDPSEIRVLQDGLELPISNSNPIAPQTSETLRIYYNSCLDILKAGNNTNIIITGPSNTASFKLNKNPRDGTYEINSSLGVFSVYCDMTTAGGGWTLCGKYDRDYGSGNWYLPQNWGRSSINLADMSDTTTFTARSSSMDCRDLIANGAQYILNIGDDDGSRNWDLVAILNIPSDIQNSPSTLWDPNLDDQDCTCTNDRIITYDENFNDVGTSHWGCDLGSRSGVTANTGFWTTCGRNDGSTFSNAGNGGCGGTRSDTVYWCFPDTSTGNECSYGCCATRIGTGCSSSNTPTHRYNLMFMR